MSMTGLKKMGKKVALLAAVFTAVAAPGAFAQDAQHAPLHQQVRTQTLRHQGDAPPPAPVETTPAPAPVQTLPPVTAPVQQNSGHAMKHFAEAVGIIALLGGGAFLFFRRRGSGLPEGMQRTAPFSWKNPDPPRKDEPVAPPVVKTETPVQPATPAAPTLADKMKEMERLQAATSATAPAAEPVVTPPPATTTPVVVPANGDDTPATNKPRKFEI